MLEIIMYILLLNGICWGLHYLFVAEQIGLSDKDIYKWTSTGFISGFIGTIIFDIINN